MTQAEYPSVVEGCDHQATAVYCPYTGELCALRACMREGCEIELDETRPDTEDPA